MKVLICNISVIVFSIICFPALAIEGDLQISKNEIYVGEAFSVKIIFSDIGH